MKNICLPCGGKEFESAAALIAHVRDDHNDPTPIIWDSEVPLPQKGATS